MAHTPGPWKWWTSNSFKRLSSPKGDGDVMFAYSSNDGVSSISVTDSDMRLIAAAPEMLTLLETFAIWSLQVFERKDVPRGIRDAASQLHESASAIIAKATGG